MLSGSVAIGISLTLGLAIVGCTVSGVDNQPAPTVSYAFRGTDFGAAWPNDSRGTAWQQGDGYRLFARAPGQFVAVRSPVSNASTDLVASSTFHKVGGPPGGGYGLIVSDQAHSAGDGRDQSGDYVVAEVGDTGRIGIWRRHDMTWDDLVPWTPSAAVHPGNQVNDLSVHVAGSHVTFSVNGVVVASIDSGLNGGQAGVFTGGDGNQVVVDRFSLVSAPRPSAPPTRASPPAPAVASTPEPTTVSQLQHLADRLLSIGQEIRAILELFAAGPNARNPVTDPRALNDAKAHLDSATAKAEDLATTLNDLQRTAESHGR